MQTVAMFAVAALDGVVDMLLLFVVPPGQLASRRLALLCRTGHDRR